MTGGISYRVDRGVAIITVDRPEHRNALSYEALAALRAAVECSGEDPAVRTVVITGAGGAFCAGIDLSDLTTRAPGERGSGDGHGGGSRRWLVDCPRPVVAAIDGSAVGLGAELTSQCDVRVCSTTARFASNFAGLGLVPDTGAAFWLLPRQVGLAAAVRLVLSRGFLSAEDAVALGYVSVVVDPESVPDTSCAEARRLSKGSPLALRPVKELLYEGLASDAAGHRARTPKALAICFASGDHREGVAAFLRAA